MFNSVHYQLVGNFTDCKLFSHFYEVQEVVDWVGIHMSSLEICVGTKRQES